MTKGSRAAAKQARPREILEAAFEEFSLRGYAATRLDDIAARVGVTKGTIYVYFENKETLFESMVIELTRPEHDTAPYLAILEQSASAALEALLRSIYVETLPDRHAREILRLLIAERNTFQNLSRRFKDNFAGPVFDAVKQILERGSRTGEFLPHAASIDPFFVLSPFLGYLILNMALPDDSPDDAMFLSSHIDMVKRLVETRPTP